MMTGKAGKSGTFLSVGHKEFLQGLFIAMYGELPEAKGKKKK